VTILVPTYNQDRFIGRAIQSGLMQDFVNLEVVVCDDASTDETEAVVRAFSHDPRLRYVRRRENLGRVANYRRALEADATGEWVVMLDGDDHLTDPCFITKAMQAAATHADVQPLFVQAGHRVVRQAAAGEEGSRRPSVDILPAIQDESQAMAGGDYLAFVYATGFFTHLGTLYRRDAAIRQGFYTSDISSSDMDSLLRLALSGNVVVLKTIAGSWVQHGGNASSNLPLDRIEENVKIFRRIAREGAAAGRIDMHSIERSLTRYEARTLAHLFGSAVGKSPPRLSYALTMMWIMLRVNPRVCLEPALAVAWGRYLRQLTRMTFKTLKARVRKFFGIARNNRP
jgi:glycosyltransferase involved in cell wall biosynthesis